MSQRTSTLSTHKPYSLSGSATEKKIGPELGSMPSVRGLSSPFRLSAYVVNIAQLLGVKVYTAHPTSTGCDKFSLHSAQLSSTQLYARGSMNLLAYRSKCSIFHRHFIFLGMLRPLCRASFRNALIFCIVRIR